MATEKTVSERAEELIATYQKWSWMWPVPDDEMPNKDVHWSLKEYLPEKYVDSRVTFVPFLNLAAAEVLRDCLHLIQALEKRIEELENSRKNQDTKPHPSA